MRVRSLESSTVWRSAPDRETPRTWPVVRNRYVIPVATAMSSFATVAMTAMSVLVMRLDIPNPCGTTSS
jgi:hypothetical protein